MQFVLEKSFNSQFCWKIREINIINTGVIIRKLTRFQTKVTLVSIILLHPTTYGVGHPGPGVERGGPWDVEKRNG
jgi:hypothetical protein